MKTKKILSALLAAIMIAMMLPMGAIFASAAPTYADTTVALVNGTEVAADGLQAAIDAATAGGTVEIVKDFTAGTINFTAGDWTINGNGKTITSDATAIANNVFVLTFTDVVATVKDLTIVTMASGIDVKGNKTNLDIKDCNIYSGGTQPGINAIPAARPDHKGGCSYAINVNVVNENMMVTIDGGVYKAYGASGYVLQVKGNAVVYDGYFVGENSSFVGRTSQNATTDMAGSTSSLSIYGGTWIKPVINRNAISSSDGASDGAVLRADRGAIMNIYGGTFANFSDVCKYEGENKGTQRDFVLITGESSNSGFFHIFGGDFYSFMSADVNATASQLIGTFAGGVTEAGSKPYAQLNFFIYGGNFYSSVPAREGNVKAIADKTALNINRISADMYTATTTENQTVTVWGKEFTGVTKWAIAYNQPAAAPATATVSVTHPDGKVFYLSDVSVTGTYANAPTYSASALVQALNGVAKDGSTVTLLADLTVKSLKAMNRNAKVTIDGNGKKLNSTNVGLTIMSGEYTIKDLTIETKGSYALKLATADTAKLKADVQNCTFTSTSENENIAETIITVTPTKAGAVKIVATANDAPINVNILDTNCAHEYGEAVDSATHTADGLLTKTCTLCQSTTSEASPKKADAHVWDEGKVTTQPTVDAEGVKTYTCECGETKTESIAKLEAPAADNDAAGDDAGADDEKKGCGGAIGIGAVAVLAVAGLACGIVSKKRED